MEVSVVVEDNSSEWLSKFSDLITIYKFIRDSLFIQLLYYFERYNRKNVLAYVDPPYLLETRSKRMYACEFDNEDHERLLSILVNFKGYVILSGYQSDLYDERLSDWYKLEFHSVTESGGRKLEVLWCNYEPPGQMSLFG